MIFQFGVAISKNAQGAFTATLVDLPQAPSGEGGSPAAAQEMLIQRSADAMTHFLLEGRVPLPLAGEDAACIGLSLPQKITASAPEGEAPEKAAFFGKREGGKMMTYSWLNNSFLKDG